MIVSRITSGLGNQLFQYATGFSIARREKRLFFVDTSWFQYFQKHTPRRVYRLAAMGLERAECECSRGVIRWIQGLAGANHLRIRQTLQTALALCGTSFINERVNFQDDGELNNINDARRVILNGYWQTFSRVSDALPEIRTRLAGSWLLSERALEWKEKMSQPESVAVHIRRGDYAQFGVPLLNADYYLRGGKWIAERVLSPKFYLFSEDEDWVRANIQLPGRIEIVSYPSASRDVEDLLLMSHCSAMIIANSSFSWWGAALGKDDRTVIAPAIWTTSGQRRPNELYPTNWTVL